MSQLKDITRVEIQYSVYNDYLHDWADIRYISVYSKKHGLLSPRSFKLGKYTIQEKQRLLEDNLIEIARKCKKYEVELEDVSECMGEEDEEKGEVSAHIAYLNSGCESFDEFIDRYNEGEF